MMKETLLQLNAVDDFIDAFPGLSYTTDATPGDGQWTFNSAGEVHAKDVSNTVFGGMQKDFYGLKIGDIIEINCEMYSISGALPKIAIDGLGGTTHSGLVNTAGYSYTPNQWKQFAIRYIVQVDNSYFRVVIGLFTADTGEYKLRNVRIKISSQTNLSFAKSMVLPYETGFQDVDSTYKSIIRKDLNTGNITLAVNCKKTDGTDFAAGGAYLLGRLPEGYRPIQALRSAVIGDASSAPLCGWGMVWIDLAGGIQFRAGVAMKNVGFIINFPTR